MAIVDTAKAALLAAEKALFPVRAYQRAAAAQRLRFLEAGQWSDQRAPVGPDVSPQGTTQDGAMNVRRYARALDENSDIAISILNTLVNAVVGRGILVLPAMKNRSGQLHQKTNDQAARLREEWARRPTADGQTSLAEAERLLCRAWLRDGEVLINKLLGRVPGVEHAHRVPFTLELLEADYLPYELNTEKPRLIVQGVEIDQRYKPLKYWLAKHHPGDIWSKAGNWTTESELRGVPADQILHLKFVRRVNQVRGYSALHGAIRSIEDVKSYLESERMAARISSAFCAFIKKSPDALTNINQDTGSRDLEMTPGMIFDNLLPGEEVGTINSSRPNMQINDFAVAELRRIAGATGTSYSTISRDYDGTYSSQRQGMIEAKAGYDAMRGYFIDHLVQPVYREFIDMARSTGALEIPRTVDPDTIYDVEIPAAALPWIDPKKEIEADTLRITSGLASQSQVIQERGGDPSQVAKRIEQDEQLFPKKEQAPAAQVSQPGSGDQAGGEGAESAESAESESGADNDQAEQ